MKKVKKSNVIMWLLMLFAITANAAKLSVITLEPDSVCCSDCGFTTFVVSGLGAVLRTAVIPSKLLMKPVKLENVLNHLSAEGEITAVLVKKTKL